MWAEKCSHNWKRLQHNTDWWGYISIGFKDLHWNQARLCLNFIADQEVNHECNYCRLLGAVQWFLNTLVAIWHKTIVGAALDLSQCIKSPVPFLPHSNGLVEEAWEKIGPSPHLWYCLTISGQMTVVVCRRKYVSRLVLYKCKIYTESQFVSFWTNILKVSPSVFFLAPFHMLPRRRLSMSVNMQSSNSPCKRRKNAIGTFETCIMVVSWHIVQVAS